MTGEGFLDRVVYQVMPDRFAIGNGRAAAEKLSEPCYGGTVARSWDELPLEPARGNDFFGGDLDGIVDHLDDLVRLGVGTVYVTPIFTAPSNHKYDAVDLCHVDPQLGGDAAFERLVAAVHARGLRLILDVSINHVSDRHPWFQAACRGEAPYRDWFTFLRPGGEGASGFDARGRYACWRDHGHMPELDLSREDVRAALFEADDSVLMHWLSRGADGWRLDVSPDLGLSVSAALRRAVERRFPSAQLVGEVMAYGADWVRRGGYHATMNYFFRDAIVGWLRGELHARQVAVGFEDAWRDYGAEGMLASWNMLASHDTPRLRNVLLEDWRRWMALVAQFTLPGVPLVYYGEEVGMEGGSDPGCRGPMRWTAETRDEGLFAAYAGLAALRRGHRALWRGELRMLGHVLDQDALVYLRQTDVPGEAVLVGLNPSLQRVRRRLLVPCSHLYHALPLTDQLGAAPSLRMDAGTVEVDLPPRCAAVWVPDDSTHAHYSFFKRR